MGRNTGKTLSVVFACLFLAANVARAVTIPMGIWATETGVETMKGQFLFPFAVSWINGDPSYYPNPPRYGQSVTFAMKTVQWDSDFLGPGNFGLVDLGIGGLAQSQISGSSGASVKIGDSLAMFPGNKTSNLRRGMDERLTGTNFANGQYLNWVASGSPLDKRVVVCPVIDDGDHIHGHKTITVVGFTAFYLDVYDPHASTLTGVFVSAMSPDILAVASDQTPPSVAFVFPTNGPAFSTTATFINIAGTATDTSGVSDVTWSNNRGGGGACAGTTSWNAGYVTLAPGINVITVTAHDGFGNVGTTTLTVTSDAPPLTKITAPTTSATYVTNQSAINLSGAAFDDIGIAYLTWSSDRGCAGCCNGTTSWCANEIPLCSGQNVITVTAHDTAGNTGISTLTVTCDTTPPVVSITGPTADPAYSTTQSSLDISGVASDTVGVANVTWSNSRGGNGSCSGSTSWSASVPLMPGSNAITITTLDQAGATDSITITRLPVTIGLARQASEGSGVYISGVVTATGIETGSAFVQSTDHTPGIKVVSDESLHVGEAVKCSGTLTRVEGEYRISGVTFEEKTDGTALEPVYVNTGTIGSDPMETLTYASGINTTGMLVMTSGKIGGVVTAEGAIYLDDGKGYQDGYGPVHGIRVHVASGVNAAWNSQEVAVIGISRVTKFTLAVSGCVNGNWHKPGTVVYVPYIDALSVAIL